MEVCHTCKTPWSTMRESLGTASLEFSAALHQFPDSSRICLMPQPKLASCSSTFWNAGPQLRQYISDPYQCMVSSSIWLILQGHLGQYFTLHVCSDMIMQLYKTKPMRDFTHCACRCITGVSPRLVGLPTVVPPYLALHISCLQGLCFLAQGLKHSRAQTNHLA